MPFIPHTEQDIQSMLKSIGVPSIDKLFDEIPRKLQTPKLEGIPKGQSELEISRLMQKRAEQDNKPLSFLGAGAYEHYIPAAVWDIASRGEFMTSYTPYQAEASQGTLQLLYEYQTMIARLTGMEVANASLYEGASALAEAILMAVRANKQATSKTILLPKTLHPSYRKVVRTIVQQQNIEIVEVPYHPTTGQTDVTSLTRFEGQGITALVVPQPNFFGILEEVDTLIEWAHQQNMFVIGVVNPIAMALLKPPGQWGQKGADIACGEGQPLGIPLSSGGPYFGFLCSKQSYVRQMPGRIVGKTVDLDGKPGFTLTLQAREQHIRRSKATSNVCTNQNLMVTAATLYLSLMGPKGLEQVALACHQNCKNLISELTGLPGVKQVFTGPTFHETVLKLPKNAKEVLHQLYQQGILGGFDLSHDYPELSDCILVCATETKQETELVRYKEAISSLLTS